MTADDYTEAAQLLVEQYREIMGAPAIGVARSNDSIILEDEEVAGFDGGSEELDALVEEYEEVIGQVAVTLARKALSDVDVEIPARLR